MSQDIIATTNAGAELLRIRGLATTGDPALDAVWSAWNALDSAIVNLLSARPRQMTECAEDVAAKRRLMAEALRRLSSTP